LNLFGSNLVVYRTFQRYKYHLEWSVMVILNVEYSGRPNIAPIQNRQREL
jgi:hypothetical protein